jgi:hypothetical protein
MHKIDAEGGDCNQKYNLLFLSPLKAVLCDLFLGSRSLLLFNNSHFPSLKSIPILTDRIALCLTNTRRLAQPTTISTIAYFLLTRIIMF